MVSALLAVAIPAQVQAQISNDARSAWGFDNSDLTPHPGVRFGVLENGMRYALMRNDAATGAFSVRLRIGAGSTVEAQGEHGFMHLVEHMIFHGSKNLPEGALPLMLSRDGLKRWSDFNAYTSFDETVYRLDLFKSDRRARETALTLMREIATNLSFERGAVEGAKEMVRAEIRERDNVQDRMVAAQNAFFFPGSDIARGSVASTEASVGRAKGEALQRLYRLHYAPQRATLVIAGDFDPEVVEAEIAARFSDWARGPSLAERPPPALVRQRGVQTRLFVDPKVATTVTIALAEPLGGADAAGRRDAQYLEHLASEMLNRRLARIGAQPGAPFVSANSAIYDHFSTGRLTRVEVAARDGDWRWALQAGWMELRRAVEQGFSQTELEGQLAASQHALGRDAAPRSASAFADAIIDAVGRGIVFTEPSDGSATQAYLARVRLEDVNAAFKRAWASPDRLIFVSHNRQIPGSDITAALAGTDYSPGR